MSHTIQHTAARIALLRWTTGAFFGIHGCGVAVEHAPAKPAPPVVLEVERNDNSWEANDLGWLEPGDEIELRGAVGPAAWDPWDGFTLRAWSDLRLFVELRTFDHAQLDLHVHDPVREETVASFGCGCGALRVELEVPAGAVFQLVVGAWQGSSEWSMRLVAEGAAWIQPPDGPRATSTAAALDTRRALGFGAEAPEDEDEDDQSPAVPIGHLVVTTPEGRLELLDLRLHPGGVLPLPAR